MNSSDISINTSGSSLAKVYGMLTLTLIPTIIGAYLGGLFNIASSGWIGSILLFVTLLGLIFAIRKAPKGIATALLFAFTFIMGLTISTGIQYALSSPGGSSLVINAFAMTVGTFGVMSFIGATTKKDFGRLGSFLFAGLIVVILASVINLFLHEPLFNLVISGVSAILFSIYIIFDVNRIVKENNVDVVDATLALYLDIINLFMSLLNILSALSGNNRDWFIRFKIK